MSEEPSSAPAEEPEIDPVSEKWEKFLTPELRRLFDLTGRTLVEKQLADGRYPDLKKRLAAMAWLRKQDKKDSRAKLLTIVASGTIAVIAAFGGAILGAWFAGQVNLKLQATQTAHERQLTTDAVSANISSLKQFENQRYEFLKPLLERLVEKSQDQEGARPWVMAPSLMRFPVYEGNVARLGLLAAPLPKDIAQFYALSYRLRSHINAVTSGALIFASRPDKVFAVGQYEQTLIEWNAVADKLLERLGQT